MSPMISVVSWAAGPTSAPVIPKTFHNPGTAFDGGGGGGGSSSGYGSVVFDGGQDYLKFPSAGTSNNLVIGTNDFTLEFWIKADSFSNGGVIYDTRSGHANSLMVNFNTSGNLRVYANSGYRITADGISTGGWHHCAIVRSGGVTRLFLNGVKDDEVYIIFYTIKK